jgi:hypothetical protein
LQLKFSACRYKMELKLDRAKINDLLDLMRYTAVSWLD